MFTICNEKVYAEKGYVILACVRVTFTESQKEGTSVGHLVQAPCRSRVT